jgi:UDP-2,4-diacetamido-2,4,6-trideoxy-beta-L-altropyranose hydrolase
VIRVDSSVHIGSGHLARCRTLARELRRRGVSVRFICRMHAGDLSGTIAEDGFDLACLRSPGTDRPAADDDYAAALGVSEEVDAAETRASLGERTPDWLIVDHYSLGQTWERALRSSVGRILVIDDLANRPHDCDVLVDQNWFGSTTATRYRELVPSSCRQLLGPRYALMQPEYSAQRTGTAARSGEVRRVLVYFGASDDTNQTARVMEALSAPEFSSIAADIVIGQNHPAAGHVEALAARRGLSTMHRGLPTLAGLMAGADLAIGAGGATTWERASLGLPAVTVVLTRNQQALTDALASDDMVRQIDVTADVDQWRATLRQAVTDREWLRTSSARSAALTDGRGASRVAHVLGGSSAVRVRRATTQDEQLLLEWVNDPDVRSHSFEHRSITPDEHARWLAARLAAPSCLLLIGEDAWNLPVGQVRFDLDPDRDESVIDISVDRAFRGLGVGERLLAAALAVWREQGMSARASAEVLDGNAASGRLFARLGFIPATPRRAHASAFVYPS